MHRYDVRVPAIDEASLSRKLASVLPSLNERQRRRLLGAEAKAIGRGGVAAVARAAGVSRPTVQKGLADLRRRDSGSERVRRAGGGRRPVEKANPKIVQALERLVSPHTRGDPMSPLRWTCKSTRTLSDELQRQGFSASAPTVGRLLHELGYSLQANAKTIEGKQHPDRDAQFRYINDQVASFLRSRDPVVSVDSKKKELVGSFKNAGKTWRPEGEPQKVKTHDFQDKELGKAVPYGVYDVGADAGWVSVGSDRDTAAFAVQTLRRWWRCVGRRAYPKARRMLVCADAGGSNSYRSRLWKLEMGRFASETGLRITVCHFPPGTSKWNTIEHRLFSHISMNWRGQPLESHEVVLELIGATKTRTGLRVRAKRDNGTYPKGIKVSDEELATVRIKPHDFHGDWNYNAVPT